MNRFFIASFSLLFAFFTIAHAADVVLELPAKPGSKMTVVTDSDTQTLTVQPGDKFILRIVQPASSATSATAPGTNKPAETTFKEKKECKSTLGKTACGYNCATALGEVKCADHPKAVCLASYGKIECGFDCKAAYGDIKCSQDPNGACEADMGTITCSK